MDNQESKLVSTLIEVAPVFYELITLLQGGERMVLTVTNRERFLYSAYGSGLDLNIRSGDAVKEGSGAYKCMQQRQAIRIAVDNSVFGVPYVVYSYALFEAGQVVGSMNIAINKTRHEILVNSSAELEQFSHTLHDTMLVVLEKTEQLRNLGDTMTEEVTASKKQLANTSDFIAGIKSIADQINILGINASIEAARVGAQGKGFAVVAQEIRRLSEGSKKFVEDIQPFLLGIKNSSEVIEGKSALISADTQALTQISEQILASTNDLKKMMNELNDIAAQII